MATVPQVLSAIDALYSPSSGPQKQKEANEWLLSFQKSAAAWTVASSILNSNGSLETRLFAAQTLRQKIVYDLRQLDAASQTNLRDSLLNLALNLSGVARPVITQLSLAIVDLAIQLPSWENPVPGFVELMHTNDAMASFVFDFLSFLPEEIMTNYSIPIEQKDLIARSNVLLESNAPLVLNVLIKYLTSLEKHGFTEKSLKCLLNWLKSGDLPMNQVVNSQILNVIFHHLQNETSMECFEICSDLVVEMMDRSGEDLASSESIIHAILPRIGGLISIFNKLDKNDDKLKSLTLIFAASGEACFPLILKNVEGFQDLIRALLSASSCPELDVVKITLNFWSLFTDYRDDAPHAVIPPAWQEIYRQLLHILIKHFRFPEDENDLTAQEMEDFRDFRHTIGDVLKDCATILGPDAALGEIWGALKITLADKSNFVWQNVEALLFALRTMSSRIRGQNPTALNDIMIALHQLPDHPKIRYSVVLLIGCYAEWSKVHPEYIPSQLTMISTAFEHPVSMSAAAQALNFMCESCGPVLVPYLDQLKVFYSRMLPALKPYDQSKMTEAMARIIASLPNESITQALQDFCLPIAQSLHSYSQLQSTDNQQTLEEISNLLDRLSVFFKYLNVPAGESHPVTEVVRSLWPVFSQLLMNQGNSKVSESFVRCIRNAMQSGKLTMFSLLPELISCVSTMYQRTCRPCYMWLTEKIVQQYLKPTETNIQVIQAIVQLVEELAKLSKPVFQNRRSMIENPDVIEDLFELLRNVFRCHVDAFLQSTVLPALMFEYGTAAIDFNHPQASGALLACFSDFFRLMSTQKMMPSFFETYRTEFYQRLIQSLPLCNRDGMDDISALLVTSNAFVDLTPIIAIYVSTLPDQQYAPHEKKQFVDKFSSCMMDRDVRRLQMTLIDFANTIRRRGTQEQRIQ